MTPLKTWEAAAADPSFGPSIGALAILAAGAFTLPFLELGALAAHMTAHIGTMNVAAPLAAAALAWSWRAPRFCTGTTLWLATVAQLALLWGAHTPVLHNAAAAHPLLLAGVHSALFIAALAFWTCIVNPQCSRWQAMPALLVSGKLACLLGVLLIFAPRPLFSASNAAHLSHGALADPVSALNDQHLAGLLMIAACPLSYVLAAVIIASQTITDLESMESPSEPGRSRIAA